ncbi:efflux RND transporter periplasmic adaptor subunit [Flavivirga rizhaonensis]|uniref:Efflux RND transporter periplasmic adaptor subunit n=1 Tax=Flavivirga rizhaonensis TaxID=2559571 RepID=A0A4S1DYZ3_9FLAO|nr:efflux RND transporter periplasmic adaptor subunit [Flavivirga rizhaonensis]TGV03430.1 efflux RND transporter periplasmic adaptor subunit [Flavivirga rizhaonensis]
MKNTTVIIVMSALLGISMIGKKYFEKVSLVLVLMTVLTFSHCKEVESKLDQEKGIAKKQYLPEKNEVNVLILKKDIFRKELVSNGRLVALEKSELKFNVSEKLEKIYVKNGDHVKKGQVLATLNAFIYRQKVNKAEIDLKEATFEFNDLQVRRGFSSNTKDSLAKKEYDMMAIKSGYKNALHQLENARFDLRSTKLTAPFSGKIANINSKQYEQISSGKEFITLINDAVFEVEFYVIESELKDIKIEDKVTIVPFAIDKKYEGHIATINPQVEKDGTILIKAQVKNDGDLLEGMNVKVFIEKDIPDQFVVPKTAVVLRDNQEVLFKVKNGKAYWTYIQTTLENSKEYALIPHPDKSSASLKPGDTIIVSDNLNLAHDSEISIKPKD